jgi:GAF domain-containing protein
VYSALGTFDDASDRAILERAVVHVPDVELDREYDRPEMSRTVGFRSILAVPMMREDNPIGVILVGRAEPGRFSDTQIDLLKTFADQAVTLHAPAASSSRFIGRPNPKRSGLPSMRQRIPGPQP